MVYCMHWGLTGQVERCKSPRDHLWSSEVNAVNKINLICRSFSKKCASGESYT